MGKPIHLYDYLLTKSVQNLMKMFFEMFVEKQIKDKFIVGH